MTKSISPVIYCVDHNTPAGSMGGIAILIPNKIKHQHIPISDIQSLEATALLLKINNHSIFVVNTYQPPSHTMHITDHDKTMNLK